MMLRPETSQNNRLRQHPFDAMERARMQDQTAGKLAGANPEARFQWAISTPRPGRGSFSGGSTGPPPWVR